MRQIFIDPISSSLCSSLIILTLQTRTPGLKITRLMRNKFQKLGLLNSRPAHLETEEEVEVIGPFSQPGLFFASSFAPSFSLHCRWRS